MEEERNQNQSVASGEERREMEVKDRGLFDFMGKKGEKEKEKEKSEEEYLVAGMEKVRVDEVEDKEEEKKKEGLLEKLHRSHSSSSSSSSSSEEEGGEGENKEKKKKKKGLKGKIKEKIGADKEEGPKEEEEKEAVHVVAQEEFVQAVPDADDDTAVTVEVVEGTVKLDGAADGGEKKGFLEKIKEKLPGHKKPSEEAAPTVETVAECAKERDDAVDANEGKENKKGFLGKIMEKLPGYNKGGEEKEKENEKEKEKKETEKTSACN